MRAVAVVGLDPHIQRGLSLLDRREGDLAEVLAAQGLVEPLDLACRGRRVRRSEEMADAVLVADPIEQHRAWALPAPAGDDLTVFGEDLVRDSVAGQALHHGDKPHAGRWSVNELGDKTK